MSRRLTGLCGQTHSYYFYHNKNLLKELNKIKRQHLDKHMVELVKPSSGSEEALRKPQGEAQQAPVPGQSEKDLFHIKPYSNTLDTRKGCSFMKCCRLTDQTSRRLDLCPV